MRAHDKIRADILTTVTADNPLSARWAIGEVQLIIEAETRLRADVPDLLAEIERLETELFALREQHQNLTAEHGSLDGWLSAALQVPE